ncbi:MAG: hypothetical protein ACREUR_12355 [Nitrosospira sp.]
MTDSNEISSSADYDEILNRLDALLRKHESKPPASAEAGNTPASFSISPPGMVAEQPSLTAADNIPTLTETVFLTPSMLSSHSDIASLLEQILDSALKDVGADLDAKARIALVQALEHRLFGL